MITKFKIFENKKVYNKPKFKCGDFVISIYDKQQNVCSIIKIDYSYKYYNDNILYLYEMKNEKDNYIISSMKENFLRKATDEEVEKMKLSTVEKKYNL